LKIAGRVVCFTIFSAYQTAPELILCAVRWYLRYSLSLRDVEELFAAAGAKHR